MPTEIEKYNSVSLLDIVYRQLKSDILKGKYKPGDRLVLGQLSKELGISHTPINLSLNRLVSEGYVEFMPRRGMRVKKVTIDDIRGIFEVRKMFEMNCAKGMVEKAQESPEFVESLVACNDEMYRYGYRKTLEDEFFKYFEGETQFHSLTVETSPNKKFVHMYQDLNANSLYYSKLAKFLSERRYEETKLEHLRIIDAIKGHGVKALEGAISTHLENSFEYLSKHHQ